jgi:hydroxymethylpyrimidine pyrophosphatase-like HAD family hydrolase
MDLEEEILVEEVQVIVGNKYIQRLFEEWKRYGKIICSVDYDDTICYWNLDNKEDVERTIKLVQAAYSTGAYIVIFTASNIDRYPEIQHHCDELQIPISCINRNPIDLPYGKNGKIYYNINLCDRSGLTQALDILEESMYLYRGWLEENKLINKILAENEQLISTKIKEIFKSNNNKELINE